MGIRHRRDRHHHLPGGTAALRGTDLTRRELFGAVTFAAATAGQTPAPSLAELEAAFQQPPLTARPRCFWLWMNGHVSRQGITLDLEAMRRAGIGGAMIFDGSNYLPKGPAGFLSPEWLDLIGHATAEGARLGVEVGMHNAPGWSSSGGPWITPERAMQQLVWSETTVSGPGAIDVALPQPPSNLNFYRDALVVAFPAAPGETQPYSNLIRNTTRAQNSLTIEFHEPFEARSATAFPSFNGRFSNVALESSNDGQTWSPVATIPNAGKHGIQPPGCRNFAPVTARFFRASGGGAGQFAGVVLHHTARLDDWHYKAGFAYRVGRQIDIPASQPGDTSIDPLSVLDLTQHLTPQGRLQWQAPAGAWTILRFGHIPTGQLNVAASDAGRGLESDKLSAEATGFHFQSVVEKVLATAPGLRTVTIDSYETGLQNWTAAFPAEFRHRAGYAITPYLPAMTGRIVGDRAVSERFLFDLRRALADTMIDRYYKRMGELCRRHGLAYYVEGYGQGVFDEMQASASPDVPCTEFWERTPWTPNRSVRMVASAAHVYGKSVVAAEAFTGEEETARWLEYPYSLKALGDLMFSYGVNEFVFHRYAHQPHPSAVPGMTMGPWGFHIDRTNTWFDHASAWTAYLTRCQYLLRQGTPVADILFFTGERPPGAENFEIPTAPAGYNYDLINAEVLLTRTTARNGRIHIQDGSSYSLLVLPPGLQGATPELMRRLGEFVRQGVRLAGPLPTFSLSLRGYPDAGQEIKTISAAIAASGLHQTQTTPPLPPDFEFTARQPDAAISWVHRRLGAADIYFVANRQRRAGDFVCSFRVSAKQPELWNAETGGIRRAAVYESSGGRTRVALRLGPSESVFVVFREAASAAPAAISKDGRPVLQSAPFPRVQPPATTNDFTMSVWAKPDTSLRLMPRESTAGRIDETGKFYVIPAAEGDTLFGSGHASAGLAVGRNGVYVIERSSQSAPAVLVANLPIAGWSHFAVNYRNGTPRLYVNGKFVKQGLASGLAIHPGIGNPPPAQDTVFHFPALDNLMRISGRPSLPSNGLAYYHEGNQTQPELIPRPLSDSEIASLAAGPVPAPDHIPPAEFWRRPDGRTEALLFQSGRYQLAGARPYTITVPAPLPLKGTWTVAFPTGRGAPASITLPELISLHRHPDEGVKYFSGTAAYSATAAIPAALLRPGRRLFLDLGRVEVTAEVLVNGRSQGIVWKEPYWLDVTTALHPGSNHIEVRVANLWTNRLIGDEQLPPENEYSSGPEHGILKVPEWYLAGQPKPPGGRTTFATWHFYAKDEPLVESGLLGPVRLLCAVPHIF